MFWSIFDDWRVQGGFISVDAVIVGRELSDDAVERRAPALASIGQAVLIVASNSDTAPALENTKPLLGARCDDHFASVRDRLVAAVASAHWGQSETGDAEQGACDRRLPSVNRRLPRSLPQRTSHGVRFEKSIMAPMEVGR